MMPPKTKRNEKIIALREAGALWKDIAKKFNIAISRAQTIVKRSTRVPVCEFCGNAKKVVKKYVTICETCALKQNTEGEHALGRKTVPGEHALGRARTGKLS